MTENSLAAYAQSQGMTKAYKKMSEQEKVAVRYKYVLDQLSSANGDFTRTSDGWANKTRVLRLQFESILSTVGQGIINIFSPFVNILNKALEKLQKLANKFRDFTAKLTGKDIQEAGEGAGAAAKAAADATSALADSEDEEAEATKNATKEKKKYLSGLDELARFSEDDEDSDDGSGITDIEPFNSEDILPKEEEEDVETLLDRIKAKFAELKDAFKEGLQLGMGTNVPERIESIKKNIESTKNSLKDIFTDPQVTGAADTFATRTATSLGKIAGAGISIGTGLAEMFTGAVADFLENKKEDIKRHIIEMFDVWGDILELISNFVVAVAQILEPLWVRGRAILGKVLEIAWDVYSTVMEIASKLFRDILMVLIQPIIDNADKIAEALDNTLKAIEPIVDGVATFVNNTVTAIREFYDEHLHPFFVSVTEGISKIIGKLLDGYNEYFAPVLEKIGKKIQEILEGPLSDLVTKAIEVIGKIIDKVREIWDEVLVPLFSWIAENIFPIISPIFDYLATTALDALKWILEKLNSLLDWLSNNKAFLEGAAAVLVGLFAGWATVQMASVIGGVVTALKGFSILSTVKNAISGFGGALSGVVSTLGGPWAIAIAALVAAAILVYKNWDKVKAFLEDKLGVSFDDLSKKLQDLKTFITDKAIAAWDKLKETMGKVRDYIAEKAIKAWEDFKKGLENLKTFLKEVLWPALVDFKDKVLVPLGTYVVEKLQAAFTAIGDYWKDELKPRLEELGKALKSFKDNVLTPIKDYLVGAFKGAFDTIVKVMDSLGGSTDSLWNDHLKPLADWVTDNLAKGFDGLKTVLSGLIDFLTGVFSGDWSKAWSGIGEMCAGAFNTVLTTISSVVNGAIGLVNRMTSGLQSVLGGIVDALNGTLKIEVPSISILGVSTPAFSWGINLSKPDLSWLQIPEITIPYLARGAVIDPRNPFLAILGDQARGTNVEAPLETIQEALYDALTQYTGPYLARGVTVPPAAGYAAAERRVLAAESMANLDGQFSQAGNTSGGGAAVGGQNITVMIDGKVLFDTVITQGRNAVIRTGRNAFEMG